MSAKTTAKKKKKNITARELGALEQRVTTNEGNIQKITEKLSVVATKDDLYVVMTDQASKTDFQKLVRLLLDDEGQPKFATKEQMEPVLKVYQGGVFTKGLVLGAAAIIGAIVGIGWGIIQLIQWAKGIH